MRAQSIRYWMAPFALTGALFGLLVGCDSGNGTASTTVTTTGALVTGLAQAFCSRQVCCSGSPGASIDASAPADAGTTDAGAAGSVDAAPNICLADAGAAPAASGGSSCEDRASVAFSQQLALVATAVSEGLMVINAGAATSCFATYQDLRCSELQSTLPDAQAALAGCGGLFTGNIPFGERCDMSAECIPHYFCLSQGTGQNVSSLSGSGSLGTCYPYEQSGQACNTSGDCDASQNLVCDPVKLVCVATTS
jgi:hypothetical protein